MIDIKLNWFLDDEPEEESEEEAAVVDVPDVPGIGGVLTVWAENEGGDTVLHATFKEISDALMNGWVVAVFDGQGSMTYVTEAEESGGTYTVTTTNGYFEADSPDVQMSKEVA